MNHSSIHFESAFFSLTGHQPFPWQSRLFNDFVSGDLPASCDLPTGLGKTSIIPIWLIALASQALRGEVTLPRRLVYIVNRRTVVDQATNLAEEMREKLLSYTAGTDSSAMEAVRLLATTLRELSVSQELPLAISTLRGQFEDNKEWKDDPTRPSIIIGTVDMIGSKLLFSGYGDGRYWRAQHAGLIGQDSLIVHDEAHLTPAFAELLDEIVRFQANSEEPRPVRVIQLSATSLLPDNHGFRLEPDDYKDKRVTERIDATKRLHLSRMDAEDRGRNGEVERNFESELVRLSLSHKDEGSKVVIYVRSPQIAKRVSNLLIKELGDEEGTRVVLLTGTIRGFERDRLAKGNRVIRSFQDHGSGVSESVFLVSTSAGEVGVDLDADHMIGDITTLDSMIQRLGRVNRIGGPNRDARIDILLPPKLVRQTRNDSYENSINATIGILERWEEEFRNEIDVSPRNLGILLEKLSSQQREEAFSPIPEIVPLTEIMLDRWSLTSAGPLGSDDRVAPYLHGKEESDFPETYVAWRAEVSKIAKVSEMHALSPDSLSRWFEGCPLLGGECLRERSDFVRKSLKELLEEHRQKERDKDFSVVLLDEHGNGKLEKLSDISKDNSEIDLDYKTVVLPIEAGGLNREGGLDPKEIANVSHIDVLEEISNQDGKARLQRWIETNDLDGTHYEGLIVGEEKVPSKGLSEKERIVFQGPPEDSDSDIPGESLVLYASPSLQAVERAETAKVRQTLEGHVGRIRSSMLSITEKLRLDDKLREALILASVWHDRGKARYLWQNYALNPDPSHPLAKSLRYRNSDYLGGYRHEFGSLLDASNDRQVLQCEEVDLVLHLISAHHGWARPSFGDDAGDPSYSSSVNDKAFNEVSRRFGYLQEKFGRWGLAWMESLLRCADIDASKPDVKLGNGELGEEVAS